MDQVHKGWAVVVTTAARPGESTIRPCIDSLIAAGWNNPIVFAEPGSVIPDGVEVINNEVRRGCYRNWLYSARWALQHTNASQILCVQDDALFHPDSKKFSEQYCLWPSENTAFVSLYTAAHYSVHTPRRRRGSKVAPAPMDKPVGVNKVTTGCLWGTLAVIWRREVLDMIVNSQEADNWLGLHPKKVAGLPANLVEKRTREHFDARRNNPALINNSDYFAGNAVNRLKMDMYFVDPSPVQHISKVSTINHGGNKGKRNCGRCASHEKPLKDQVIVNSAPVNVLPRIIVPAAAVGTAPRPVIMVRSSYVDRIASEHRWSITQQTLLKSLEVQKDKRFEVKLICDRSDPLFEEKVSAFCSVAETTVADADWYNKPHDDSWKRLTRVDDDDMLSVDFVRLINETTFDGTECILTFPVGSFFDGHWCFKWNYPNNQFITLQTNTSFTPYHFHHYDYAKRFPAVYITNDIHWLWIRHTGALSGGVHERHKTVRIVPDSNRFPHFNIEEARASELLHSPTDYVQKIRSEFGRLDDRVKNIVSRAHRDDLTEIAAKYNTDKGFSFAGISHQYTLIYDRLFGGIRDSVTSVLEFGVGDGSSLKMWSDYFPNASITGLDKRRYKLGYPRVATHVFRYHSRPLDKNLRFDIIIDDADHISSHQRVGFSLHSCLVKPGGYYVIEDLVAHRMHPKYNDEYPTMLETCREWVKNPPDGWSCAFYGDQLCILKRDG